MAVPTDETPEIRLMDPMSKWNFFVNKPGKNYQREVKLLGEGTKLSDSKLDNEFMMTRQNL